jgi:hypothetical protein
MEARHPNHPGEMGTDASLAEAKRDQGELNARAVAIQKLTEAGVPFVVGGAYAYAHYTGIYRDTKDLDLFPRKADALRALEVLAADGWRTERTDEVWLYKAFRGEWFVDFIFSSGNGVAVVDDEWFANAQPGVVFGQEVLIAPVEEVIWSKAFVLERERFDGSDVIHLIRAAGPKMDWERVLRRFDRHWEVLLAHLQLFRFAYPTERSTVPRWLMVELLTRSLRSVQEGDWAGKMCRGNLLSRVNYEVDITRWGYQDGRRWDEQARGEEADGAGSDRQGAAGSRR